MSSIDADDDCLNLLYQAWYLDDGVLAGSKSSLLRALTIIENIGPCLGIFINLSKCEVFCGSDTTMLPVLMKAFHTPNLDIHGAPIGDYIHCAKFIASKWVEALKLLSRLQDVAVIDPQIFDIAVKECFATCSALDLTEHAWQQAQLGLSFSASPNPICDSLKGLVNILASGVQQGDPLGPMLFALVLHKLVSSIEADDDCINLSFNAWYLDDGLLAGERSAVVRALHLIDELGPHLGLLINYPKCEVFSRNGTEALEEVRTWTGSRWHWP
eukprot:Em0001g2465a